MTRRKAAQEPHAESPIELAEKVVAQVRAMVAKPYVEALDDHFAGYFNELGLFVTVRDDTDDAVVIDLRNDLLHYLNSALPKDSAPFKWLVCIKRDSKTIDVFAPGDSVKHRDDSLWPL